MSENTLNAALEYLDMGLSVIPVRKDKKPYVPWKEYQKRHPTEAEIEAWWEKWPEANVAIVTGKISGNLYVLDGDGPSGVKWITDNAPKTGVYSVTSPGKIHAVMRAPADATVKNGVRVAPEVDIRGEGGYIVAPPSAHKLGHKYQWQFIMNGWDDIAELDPAGIGNGRKTGNLNIDLTATKTAPINAPAEKGSRNNTLAQLAGKWVASGLDEAEVTALAKSWNDKNFPPLGESELTKTVKSIFKTHALNHPVTCNLPPADTNQYVQKEIPAEILTPGGVLQDVMNYIDQNSPVSVPYYNLAAAITYLGNIMGQRVATETGLRTNLYTIVLGYSGSGKNSPFNTLPQLTLFTDAAKTLGPTEITSSPAIMRWLGTEGGQICLMMLDEIGLIIKGIQNPNSAAADVPRMLTKLFTGTNRPETKPYAGGENIVVSWHHLSMFGASTPERFWEALTPGEVVDGFLARVLIFDSRHDASYPRTTIQFDRNPKLESEINAIFGIKTKRDESRGNLERVPVPKIIPRTMDAQAYFDKWARSYHALKNKYKGEIFASIYGRAAEHCAKIALIHAVSNNYTTSTVDVDSVKWAAALMDHLVSDMVEQVKICVHENEIARSKQRIIDGIIRISKERKYGGATIRDLQRGPCQKMLSRDMKNYLDALLLGEYIGSKTIVNKNNVEQVVYYVAEEVS